MTRPPFARLGVGSVVAVQAAVLLAMAPFYGPHRDELYFASAGDRLAWGYPDQPTFTPLLARAATEIAPDNLVVMRIAPIVGVALLVVLAACFARLLGGDAKAQVVTAAVVAASGVTMAVGHRLSTATFDMLAWTAIAVVVTAALVEDRPRLWLVAGLIAGVGLNNKHAVVFCLFGILVGVAVVRATRPALRTPWPWLGGLIAAVLWIPNLLWQAGHDWPVLELSADIAEEFGGIGGRLALVGQALVMFSPVVALVWVLGVVRLLRRPDWERARPVAVGFLVVTLTFLVIGGKGYYLAGAIVPLVAAGCTHLVQTWSARAATRAGVVLALSPVVAWPALVPVLPAAVYADSFFPAIDADQMETIGWPGYVDQVDVVVASLPEADRRTAVVFTGNYGEAGALEWYDAALPVYSGHNGWQEWGPPPESAGPVVVVAWPETVAGDFAGCEERGALTNDLDLDNEETEARIWLCDGPVGGSWTDAWPDLSRYAA